MNTKGLKILIVITGAALVALFILLYKSIKEEDAKMFLSNDVLRIRGDFTKNTIPDFRFVNQYGEQVSHTDFEGRIYVADFFFTTCPTICPVMARNKIHIQEAFKDNDQVLLLSHSIDTMSDSIPRLKAYSERVGALRGKWHLVTGERKAIYDIAKDYYITAQENDLLDRSFIHDGSFILVDDQRHIRGIYDGTDYTSTKTLIANINTLLEE